ncbi:MAG: type II secretion system F family protein [Candidatus Eisenbacteria sp.]|nr:type II secretion system F family protein [Candidatus Eisenbacteria bacterium]
MAIDLARVAAARTEPEEGPPAGVPSPRPRSGWWQRLAGRPIFTRQRITLEDLVLVTQQLVLLLQSGNGLVPSVGALAEQMRTPQVKEVLEDVRARLEEGRPFSACLEAYPRAFDHLFVSIVRAGEATGELRASLARLAQILEIRRQLRARIREAMTYPALLTGIMVVVMIFMLTYMVPRFSAIFAGLGDELPWSTRLILGTAELLRSRWWALLPIAGVAGFGARALWRRASVQRTWDRLKLSLPFVGTLYSEAYLFQLFSSFGLLLGSRVPHLEAIEIARRTVRNVCFAQFFETLAEHAEGGRGIAQAFREARFLPETVKLMVSTGETSGALDTVMGQLSEHYRENLESDVRRLSTLIEPVMLVGMGLMVGFVAISFIVPLFKLSSVVH